jgi:molecular chaperone IbpA
MALAGFGKEDIQVEIAENTLSVRSIKENSEDEDTQYRGISFRRFERKFTLADDLVVNNANLENGMLYIDIERIIPEEKKPRLIEVK